MTVSIPLPCLRLTRCSYCLPGTYYATGLGACGIYNVDTDYIAAASHILYDSFPGYAGGNPNDNPICNLKITATCKYPSAAPTPHISSDRA